METKNKKNKKPKFLRRGWFRYSKLGHKRKKKQVWRRPSGRDNKMRDKRRGYPVSVNVGYKRDKVLRHTLEGKKPVVIYNLNDLKKVEKNSVILLGKVGMKKKLEIMRFAKEKGLVIHRTNPEKFLKNNSRKPKDEKSKPDKNAKEKKEK